MVGSRGCPAAVFVFLVGVPLIAGTIKEVLEYTVRNVDERLGHGLHMFIERVSAAQKRTRTLKDAEIVEFARHMCAGKSDASVNEIISSARDSLRATLIVSMAEPAVAILARRTLMACIVLRWMDHKNETLDDQAAEHLAEITRGFYSLHVESVAQRGLMEYLHISKSGGTTFSATAKRSNCSMAPGIGQLEELGDLPRWIDGRAFKELTGGTNIMWSYYSTAGRPVDTAGCRERYSYLRSHGFNYVSNEFTMHGGAANMRKVHACPQFVNVVTLRDPDSRLVSHLHFMLARIKKRTLGLNSPGAGGGGDGATGGKDGRGKAAGAGVDGDDYQDDDGAYGGDKGSGGGGSSSSGDLFRGVFCPGTETTWERVAPPVVDNYMTRCLIGERAFHAPVGSIGWDHVEVARRVLLSFDVVLDLDAGAEAADAVLWQALGWGVKMSETHARSSADVYRKLNYTTAECHNGELQQQLRTRQESDRHVYGFGRVLAFLDRVHFAMADALGLQPTIATTGAAAAYGSSSSGDAATATAAAAGTAGGGTSCGLLGAAGPGPGPRRRRNRAYI